jgi:hypothetical protein
MPYSQDYIKRMLEQFGEFLLALKKLMSEDKQAEAREQLDLAYKEALGLDPEFVRNAPDDYLILSAGQSRVGDVDKSLVLADLLSMDGDWHALAGDDETAGNCYAKAMNVMAESVLRQPFGVAKEHVERVDALEAKIEQYDPPFETRERMFRLHERIGQFAAAEDDLYHLLDMTEGDEDWHAHIIERGVIFYQRLLTLKDHELMLGGLPRSEVQEGLEDLMDRDAGGSTDAP